MKKQDLTRFVGLPYKFLVTDFTGVDCIGLCQLFFYEHGYPIEIRDGRPNKKYWYLTVYYSVL
jgi:cell wall-associated NlpC family hydrolase